VCNVDQFVYSMEDMAYNVKDKDFSIQDRADNAKDKDYSTKDSQVYGTKDGRMYRTEDGRVFSEEDAAAAPPWLPASTGEVAPYFPHDAGGNLLQPHRSPRGDYYPLSMPRHSARPYRAAPADDPARRRWHSLLPPHQLITGGAREEIVVGYGSARCVEEQGTAQEHHGRYPAGCVSNSYLETHFDWSPSPPQHEDCAARPYASLSGPGSGLDEELVTRPEKTGGGGGGKGAADQERSDGVVVREASSYPAQHQGHHIIHGMGQTEMEHRWTGTCTLTSFYRGQVEEVDSFIARTAGLTSL
jgi:hypothetical protein